MLTVLGGSAEYERDRIRARTGEGRERAIRRRDVDGPPDIEAHWAAVADFYAEVRKIAIIA